MNINYWGNKILEFLEGKVKAQAIGDIIEINRDSIVEYISDIDSSLDEEECYADLIQRLKEEFGKRFHYQMKTDDNLYLDMIGE